MTNLRAFQEEAKNDLLRHARNEIKRNTPTSLLLDAPTGSGKTVIMSQLLKEQIQSGGTTLPLRRRQLRHCHGRQDRRLC